MRRLCTGLALGSLLAGCGRHPGGPSVNAVDAGDAGGARSDAHGVVAAAPVHDLAPLHAFEDARRRSADFAHLPPSDRGLGPDPIAVRAVPGRSPPRFVGLLRGRDALVLLDASLHELARAATPPLPTGLAVTADEVFVTGEQSPAIEAYRLDHDTFRDASELVHLRPDAFGLRDVAVSRADGSAVHAVDERSGKLFTLQRGGPRQVSVTRACTGAFRIVHAGQQLVVDCLLDHTLAVFDLDARGRPVAEPVARIQHDGPLWSCDAAATPEGLLIAAGGVEDHPLDRTEGSFGFIDSFVYLYRVPPHGAPERLAAVNVSELGVITPKVLLLVPGTARPGGARVTVAGYGADRLADLAWPADLHAAPAVTTRTILPGVASMAAAGDLLVFADPLLDAWFSLPATPAAGASAAPTPVPVPDSSPPSPRAPLSVVGEALFFTNLMAPWDRSEGRLSRFTCETCHFEGYVDGRTHHTGRGDVHATTKPLLGLFNNRPHFSRALDADMATMVFNEFNVAGAKSDHDAWFTAADAALPWIGLLGVPVGELDALGLRRALMTFLMDFNHRPNPAVLLRDAFTDRERRGADVFARRCEGCHEARLSTDEPATRLPEAQWEKLVLSREGPIVWASTGYRKTGVEPYVHDLGARPPSLRRLYKKWPYFTNGSAKSLADVLGRARFQGDGFWHDRGPEGAEPLGDADREALLGFLDLL